MKIKLLIIVTVLIILILSITNNRSIVDDDYKILLSMFPVDEQGNGLELKASIPSQQPMTYGLVLASESLHYKYDKNKESEHRIKNAVNWITENSDANQDGNLGWGLPQSFDAFADGTINPENHSYTITTAIVLDGLMDSLSIDNFWTEAEEKEIKKIVSEVILYWLKEVYIGDDDIGYLGYSPEPTDMIYTPNVSSMFLSSLVRIITEHDGIFNESDKQFVLKRTHAIANKLVNTVHFKEGIPYWDYAEYLDDREIKTNDLVHHIYILWGIEEYRNKFDEVKIPFSKEDSIASVDSFWKENRIFFYPQNQVYIGDLELFNERPSNLWGTGMMLAFYAKYDYKDKADKTFEVINNTYGKIPRLTVWPVDYSNNKAFYARYAAHVLFGLSYRDFYNE
ncbi:hypothetical protein GC105_09940 [Alkalibaculum sp. M08DMB]|uniref:Uncharacterized protein n=1 Tax=Alkalibaculum sporogenes TaxID=2655001 RepID=A0A6A7K9P6_9FIRM|nr:hypothetical protein [Alkalibaculum sporogenes]MPW26112.1 hypothetical protein [Alkalibaculum sporogenes]